MKTLKEEDYARKVTIAHKELHVSSHASLLEFRKKLADASRQKTAKIREKLYGKS